jgi:CRISPR-associated protein Csb3
MNTSEPFEPIIRVNVDLSNPGQFFACCGLLELADRLWSDSRICGRFTSEFFELIVGSSNRSLKGIIDPFVKADLQQLDLNDNAASPLHLGDPFKLRLDWWKKFEGPNKNRLDLGGGDQLKPWAGKQAGPLIFGLMKNACHDINLVKPLDDARAVYDTKDGRAKKKTTSPFYFDARHEETSLDIGFSPDEQDMSVMVYPAVESLALVGLQRFRPTVDEKGQVRSFLYTAWAEPLPLSPAMAAASGIMPVPSCGTFRFTKPSRGGEYLTMFSRATRERSTNV